MEATLDSGVEQAALRFVSQGMCCNCLVFLSKSEFWPILAGGGRVQEGDVWESPKSVPLVAVIKTLINENILLYENGSFFLSELGKSLKSYLGLIDMLFEGYAPLMAQQGEISREIDGQGSLLNGKAIAEASVLFGNETVDPILVDVLEGLDFSGPICDLGAGNCERLIKLHNQKGWAGLGIDNCKAVVEETEKNLRNYSYNVSCQFGDVTNLKSIYPDIQVLMQFFVFHDFVPTKTCVDLINSLVVNFPSLKYFVYVDIVAPSLSHPEMMPGFDYVHGLLGIKTRTYEETVEMFERTVFDIGVEKAIEGLPNTYLWVLEKK